jgi:hypothetical protein
MGFPRILPSRSGGISCGMNYEMQGFYRASRVLSNRRKTNNGLK